MKIIFFEVEVLFHVYVNLINMTGGEEIDIQYIL
jgi:hypothetical protein